MQLYETITQLRKARGMSQEEMAQHIGVSRQAASKWESGHSVPDIDNIIALAALFNVTTDYLLTGKAGLGSHGAPRSIDMRIFAGVATVINLLGLALAVGGGSQFATVLAALIFMAVGCMVFGAGLLFATQHKTNAAHWFAQLNLWPLLYLPLWVVHDQIRMLVVPLLRGHSSQIIALTGHFINSAAAFWLGYVVFCLLVVLALWRRKKTAR